MMALLNCTPADQLIQLVLGKNLLVLNPQRVTDAHPCDGLAGNDLTVASETCLVSPFLPPPPLSPPPPPLPLPYSSHRLIFATSGDAVKGQGGLEPCAGQHVPLIKDSDLQLGLEVLPGLRQLPVLPREEEEVRGRQKGTRTRTRTEKDLLEEIELLHD